MHKSKKKLKTDKIPQPIKIKKEKTEEDRTLHSMAHYVDDRLELVKQIFGTLKPKTITNLAPDFLKKKNLEDIEELCLNELLCISTKRLLSIINETKCPTDTESSDDSDVQHKEEHISLEEISSDSEIDGGKKRTVRKKKKIAAKNSNEKETPAAGGGQISVLELLELQARARAIRSQLAMEPVTKIEVDSDEEGTTDNAAVKSKRKSIDQQNERKRKSSLQTNNTTAAKLSGDTNGASQSSIVREPEKVDSGKRTARKIKIKRNYRNYTNEEENNAVEASNVQTQQQPVQLEKSATKPEQKSRSASPDVIPIQAEPETLLISDSSDEGEAQKSETKKPAEIVVESPKRTRKKTETTEEEEEGEIREYENEPQEIEEQLTAGQENEMENLQQQSLSASEEAKELPENENVEKDDGDNNSQLIETNDEGTMDNTNSEKTQNSHEMLDVDSLSNAKTSAELNLNSDTEDESTQQSSALPFSDSNAATNEGDENDDDADAERMSVDNEECRDDENDDDDDDQNDDVISIEGGDLETEMSEQLALEQQAQTIKTEQQEEKQQQQQQEQIQQQDDDIISLDTSEDDADKDSEAIPSESWQTRYMKSAKVSKVLAESRLGKRVRDKIKKTKRSAKESSDAARASVSAAAAAEKSRQAFQMEHEDGSVEQYKELLKMRQKSNFQTKKN